MKRFLYIGAFFFFVIFKVEASFNEENENHINTAQNGFWSITVTGEDGKEKLELMQTSPSRTQQKRGPAVYLPHGHKACFRVELKKSKDDIEKFFVEYSIDEPVSGLNHIIESHSGVPEEMIYFIYAGEPLNNYSTLREARFFDDPLLHAFVKK